MNLWSRFRSHVSREALDGELSDEIQFHLDMLAEQNVRQGMSHEEAQQAARREFGGVTRVKESYREARGIPFLESLAADVMYGARRMRRNILLTCAIVITLAIGIGASTAVFTIANNILLRPLDIPQPHRAVVLASTEPAKGTAFSVAEGVFHDWRANARSFEEIAACWDTSMIITAAGQPHEVNVLRVTSGFFPLSGLSPTQGRLFDRTAERPGRDDVALLDDGFWEREFGRDPGILGRKITLDDRIYTVIGILPSGFSLGRMHDADVWLPLVARENARGGGGLTVLARLKPSVTIPEAQAEMDVIQSQIVQLHQEDSQFGAGVKDLRDWIVSEAKPALYVLSGAVALLLLLCCANIANLLLARGIARQREFAIRASAGGGPGRLTRQLLVEHLMLAMLGGSLGCVLAFTLVRAAPHVPGVFLPRMSELQPDLRMLGIAAAITLTSALIFGLIPALRATSRRLSPVLAMTSTAATAGRRDVRGRRALVMAQLGLSLILLSGAGLLLQTYFRLSTVDVGFSKANVTAVEVRLPYRQYSSERVLQFHQSLMREVEQMPGVLEASTSDRLPLQAVLFPFQLTPAGSSRAPVEAMARHIGTGYFRVLGIPLLAGREFEPADDTRTVIPVILNREAADRLFGTDMNVIGKHLTTNYKQRKNLQIVGFAATVHQLGLKLDPGPQLYLPVKYGSPSYTIARLQPNAPDLAPAIREAVFRLDRGVPAPNVSEVRTWFEYEVAKPRLYALLISGFAIFGLLVAAIGMYGVVAFDVARRTQEFGVRIALGATGSDILRLVLSDGKIPILAGLVIGLSGSIAATRLLTTLLYGVKPNDATTFGAAAALLVGVALLASYLAARHVTTLEPTAALRHE